MMTEIAKALEILKPHWGEIDTEFESQKTRFLELASFDHDAIGRILRSHLVIENYILDFLEKEFGLDDLQAARLNFSQKAHLLPANGSAASFVRPGIIQLNSVRNKFSHKLNYKIERNQISEIFNVLKVARPSHTFENCINAVEAFTPVACTFLTVPPQHLRNVFIDAFGASGTHKRNEG